MVNYLQSIRIREKSKYYSRVEKLRMNPTTM